MYWVVFLRGLKDDDDDDDDDEKKNLMRRELQEYL